MTPPYLSLTVSLISASGLFLPSSPWDFISWGFHNEEIRLIAEKAGVSSGTRRPDRIPYAEYRVHDPEGNGIDISEKGWEV